MEYDLRVIHANQKSFYGKARVEEQNGKTLLWSYNTNVAYIENGKAIVYGSYSNTTLRHIKEFLKQNGFKAESMKQILTDYKQSDEDKQKVEKEQEEKANNMFKSISMVASMGELFCNNQKDKNDWKLRMIKAGLENKGLIMPEDWETLTEEEKEKRLNSIIEHLKQ